MRVLSRRTILAGFGTFTAAVLPQPGAGSNAENHLPVSPLEDRAMPWFA